MAWIPHLKLLVPVRGVSGVKLSHQVDEFFHVDVGQVLAVKVGFGHLVDLSADHPSGQVPLHQQPLPERVHLVVAGRGHALDLLLDRSEVTKTQHVKSCQLAV